MSTILSSKIEIEKTEDNNKYRGLVYLSLNGEKNFKHFPFELNNPFEIRKCSLRFWRGGIFPEVFTETAFVSLNSAGYGKHNPSDPSQRQILFDFVDENLAKKVLSFYGLNLVVGSLSVVNQKNATIVNPSYYAAVFRSWLASFFLNEKEATFMFRLDYGDYCLTKLDERQGFVKGLRQLLYNP